MKSLDRVCLELHILKKHYFLILQVNVKVSSVALVEIQITNSTDHLYLHWGGMQNRKE